MSSPDAYLTNLCKDTPGYRIITMIKAGLLTNFLYVCTVKILWKLKTLLFMIIQQWCYKCNEGQQITDMTQIDYLHLYLKYQQFPSWNVFEETNLSKRWSQLSLFEMLFDVGSFFSAEQVSFYPLAAVRRCSNLINFQIYTKIIYLEHLRYKVLSIKKLFQRSSVMSYVVIRPQ